VRIAAVRSGPHESDCRISLAADVFQPLPSLSAAELGSSERMRHAGRLGVEPVAFRAEEDDEVTHA